VEDCINLLDEETPNGGLKPYRVCVDNDKCIGCQMCYSDDLTKVHRHKETGEILLEYAGRYYDSSKRPLENDKVPKKFQLDLPLKIRTTSWSGRVAWDGKENIEINVIDYTLTKTEEAKGERDQRESL
jgi:ferredoxin